MKNIKILLLMSMLLSTLWAKNEYIAVVIDGNKLSNRNYLNEYKDVPAKIINSRYKDIFKSKWGRLDVYDVQTGKVIATLKKRRNKKRVNVRKFMIDTVNRYKKIIKDSNRTEKSKLDITLDNIRINSRPKKFATAEIYFLDSLLVNTDNIDLDLEKGFPNIHCLEKKYPFEFNKKFLDNNKTKVYVYNLKDDFSSQYAYYFSKLFQKLNAKLVEYRKVAPILSKNGNEDIGILPISLDPSVKLTSNSRECKLEDGTISLTDIIEDDITINEVSRGQIELIGYNKNRANTDIAIRFNGEEFTIRANDKGEYRKVLDLAINDNILEVKMMNNKYKIVDTRSYKGGVQNTFECKLSQDGRNILLKGRNVNKKPGERVRISYMGHNDLFIAVKPDGSFSQSIPVLDKENMLSLIISDTSKIDCPPLKSNKFLKDSIESSVKNMTATICLMNEDRKVGDTVSYEYNGKEVTRILKNINGKTCFKMPLDYTKIHDFKIKQLDGTYRNEQLITDLRTDFVRIRITFNNCDSDMDLYVLEPKQAQGSNSQIVYFSNKKNYGKLDTDSHKASEGPENYSLSVSNAPKGKYYYWVNWYDREKDFKKYHRKECSVRLDIIDQGRKSIKSLTFMKTAYTNNKNKQLKLSNYPGYGFKKKVNGKVIVDFREIQQNAFSFEIE